eukprot:2027894-Lingulodinium_polyedra.AAC.1
MQPQSSSKTAPKQPSSSFEAAVKQHIATAWRTRAPCARRRVVVAWRLVCPRVFADVKRRWPRRCAVS